MGGRTKKRDIHDKKGEGLDPMARRERPGKF